MKRKASDKLDQLLERLDQLIALMAGRAAYYTTAGPTVLRRQVRDATQQMYMSGRWHRRDGDVYGIDVQSPGVKDAYSPPGDLRPPDQR